MNNNNNNNNNNTEHNNNNIVSTSYVIRMDGCLVKAWRLSAPLIMVLHLCIIDSNITENTK